MIFKKDEDSKPKIVRMRRIGKLFSWWNRGKADTNIINDPIVFAGILVILLAKFFPNFLTWHLISLMIGLCIVVLYIGYWDSEKGFRRFQNKYENQDLSPPTQETLNKLDIIINKINELLKR
jgi:hypothetical protein